jgi:hypothetical protein
MKEERNRSPFLEKMLGFTPFCWLVSQPASRFFSHTKSAPTNQQYFYLTTNQHQLPATASRTECPKDDLKHSKTNQQHYIANRATEYPQKA